MKRFLFLLTALLCALLCASALADTRIMVVSDTHYLSPTLYEPDDEHFLDVVSQSAGQATQYSAELLNGLVAEARHQHPDLLLITGDLTYDGETVSAEEMAAALRALEEDGIRVAVIPGNHDINSPSAVSFIGGVETRVDNLTPSEFRRIWAGMIADEMPGPGFSGVVKLNDKVWLALGDYSEYTDRNEEHGMATEEHLTWITEVTEAANAAGVTLITATHQSLVPHTSYSYVNFCIMKAQQIIEVEENAGVRLNLSGHMHDQHVKAKAGLSDIATGAWCLEANRYGIVTVSDDGVITYDAYSCCDEHLPEGMRDAVAAFFDRTMRKGMRVSLISMGVFDQQSTDMINYALTFNRYSFDGTLYEHPELLTDPVRAQWAAYRKSSTFANYIETVLTEPIVSGVHWSSAE